jgi:hypothetical protein
VKEMRLKLVEDPMLVVAWFTSHARGVEVPLLSLDGLLSRHEDVLDLRK